MQLRQSSQHPQSSVSGRLVIPAASGVQPQSCFTSVFEQTTFHHGMDIFLGVAYPAGFGNLCFDFLFYLHGNKKSEI